MWFIFVRYDKVFFVSLISSINWDSFIDFKKIQYLVLLVAYLYQTPCAPSLVPQKPSPLFPTPPLFARIFPKTESPQPMVVTGTISVPSGATGLVKQSVMEGAQGPSLASVGRK